MFADEMGVALALSPAAKTALIVAIAAAIQVAVTEKERGPSSSFVTGPLAKRARAKAYDRSRFRPPPSGPSPR
jgi:hypothetical protein